MKKTLLWVLFSILLYSHGVFAQSDDVDREELVLEEIVVTAQKRAQNLQDVPISILALSATDLKESGVRTLSDLSQLVPSLTITDTQSEDVSISLRGISSNDFGFAVEQSIPIYLDGVYLGLGAPLLGDLNDVVQAEVLKGPQGTLFGRNASGGAVNVRTAGVDSEQATVLNIGFGNHELLTAAVTNNTPISDNLGMRLNLGIRKRDGWQTNSFSGKNDGYEQDRIFGRVKFQWTALENLTLQWTSDYKDEDDNAGYSYLYKSAYPMLLIGSNSSNLESTNSSNGGLSLNGTSSSSSALDYHLKRKIQGHSLKVDWDINYNLKLESITAYRSIESDIQEDNDGSRVTILHIRPEIEADEYSQEFRLSGNTESLDWFVGVNAYRQDSDGRVTDTIGFPVPASVSPFGFIEFTEFNAIEGELDSYGIFGDIIWSVNERLDLIFGARYSYDEKRQKIFTPNQNTLGSGVNLFFPTAQQLTNAEGLPDPSLANLSDDWNNLSLRGVLNYRYNDESLVYFSIAQGYKSGGFNSFPVLNPVGPFFPLTAPGQLVPYDEEEVISYELGIKSELLDNRLRLNGSLFYYDWDDLQALVTRGVSSFTINAGKAIGYGADLDLTYKVTDGFLFNASINLLNAEYDENVPGSSDIREGESLPYAPDFSANVGMSYSESLSANLDMKFNVNYTYRDKQNIVPNVEISGYGLLNSRISLMDKLGKWEVALWGRNLTDEAYIDRATDFFDAAGFISARSGERRTYGIELAYYF